MSLKRIALYLLALAVLAMTAAGCGDEDSSADTIAASSLTKAEFVKQATALCVRNSKETTKQFQAYVREGEADGSNQEDVLSGSLEAVTLPGLQKNIDEIRALGAPQGEEKQVEAILLAAERGMEQTGQLPTPSLPEFGEKMAQAFAAASKYGIADCL